MNKFLISAALLAFIIGAQAQSQMPTNTVLEVLTFQDDTPVVLKGKIDRGLSGGKYQFSDSTGMIVLDIDDELLANNQIMQDQIIEVRGEVDKGWFSTEIDVEEIMPSN